MNERKLNTLVLLRLHKPLKDGEDVHIVVKGFTVVKNGVSPSFDRDEYIYNDHTCPWNYLRLPIKAGEDVNPVGIFVHQETVLMPGDYDDYKSFLDTEAWEAIFPSLRNKGSA